MARDPTLPEGWTITGTMRDGQSALVLSRLRDNAQIVPSADSVNWADQIERFEFAEGVQWTPAQIAAMKPTRGEFVPTPDKLVYDKARRTIVRVPMDAVATRNACPPLTQADEDAYQAFRDHVWGVKTSLTDSGGIERRVITNAEAYGKPEICVTPEMIEAGRATPQHTSDAALIIANVYRAMRALEPSAHREPEVPFIRGGTYNPADAERYGCRLIWWPEELPPPFIDGERGSRTIRPESVKLTLQPNGYECDPALLALETALARVATLEAQLPDDMKECTIQVRQCEAGHSWLTAANWLQHDCPHCQIATLTKSVSTLHDDNLALRDELGRRPVAFTAEDVAPREAKHNPFREFSTDPRRIGNI